MSARVKEINEIVDSLIEQGWRVERGKHLCAYPPDPAYRMVYFASTPSDNRAIKNIKSDLRRSGAKL